MSDTIPLFNVQFINGDVIRNLSQEMAEKYFFSHAGCKVIPVGNTEFKVRSQ